MKVRALEKLGAEILVVSADVASEEQMRETINQAIKRFGKIDGVIHAAGIASRFRTIQELEESECDSIFYPKIEGVRVLEKVLEGMELDFCFLMTSLSAILGGLGMAANSASNSYMSAFARRHNRTSPVPWTCISWDGWQLAGENTQGVGFGAALAQLAITPKEGVERA
jgi:NADP-dependent 3-hydroxy acid dehydrogenase YdfG